MVFLQALVLGPRLMLPLLVDGTGIQEIQIRGPHQGLMVGIGVIPRAAQKVPTCSKANAEIILKWLECESSYHVSSIIRVPLQLFPVLGTVV